VVCNEVFGNQAATAQSGAVRRVEHAVGDLSRTERDRF